MNEIVGIKVIVISNIDNFACENMVSKPTVVELEQGGPLGGLAHWAVNPSTPLTPKGRGPRLNPEDPWHALREKSGDSRVDLR